MDVCFFTTTPLLSPGGRLRRHFGQWDVRRATAGGSCAGVIGLSHYIGWLTVGRPREKAASIVGTLFQALSLLRAALTILFDWPAELGSFSKENEGACQRFRFSIRTYTSALPPIILFDMFKQVTLTNKCLAIVMQRNDAASGCGGANEKQTQHRSTNSRSTAPENGFRIFQDFQDENRASFWNPGLVQSVNALEFVGFVRPGTLFVSGSELHLECLRGAWARRVLKPPPGFTIKRLGKSSTAFYRRPHSTHAHQ